MLKFKLLNEAATLNNYTFVDVKEYLPTLPFTINIQVLDSETKNRLIPKTPAKLNAIFQLRDGTTLTVAGSLLIGNDDRSMWKVLINKTQATDIVGSNVQIDLDFEGNSTMGNLSDSTDLRSGMAYSVLSKITFDGEC